MRRAKRTIRGRRSCLSPLLPLLVSLLSGCIDEPVSPRVEPLPCPLTIDSAPAGSSYSYAAEGDFWDVAHTPSPVDWGAAGSSDGQGPVIFPAGSTLRVEVAARTSNRLGASGAMESAFQVTFWATRPKDPESVAINDEWISAEDGSLVQSVLRNIFVQDENHVMESVRFLARDHPGLLLAPLVWNRTLALGQVIDATFASERALPIQHGRNETVRLEVSAVWMSGQDCRVRLQGWHRGDPDYAGVEALFSMEFRSGVSLPTRLDVAFHQNGTPAGAQLGDGFHLTLTKETSPESVRLPLFQPALTPKSGLPVGQPEAGFLSETGGIFPTDWLTAYRAMLDDASVSEWRTAHPNAQLSRVVHVLGDSASSVIDRWEIEWWPGGAGPGLQVFANQVRPIILGLGGGLQVSSAPDDDVEQPMEQSPRISLRALAEVHRAVRDQEPEVLVCTFSDGSCRIGTHDATNRPKAGSTGGSSFIQPGLIAEVGTGLLFQIQSVDPVFAGPAAG